MPEVLDVVPVPQSREVEARDFMPLLTVDQAVQRKKDINKFIDGVMREGEDYGAMPGGQTKKVLMKPGAEKLCSIFGFTPRYVPEVVTEDWTGADHGGEPLFYYRYTCQLWRGERLMGEAVGSCNSHESKYRYRWVSKEAARQFDGELRFVTRGGRQFEPKFAIDKAETSGKYGKPAEYWQAFVDAIEAGTAARAERKASSGKVMTGYEIDVTQYRIPNPDVADTVNTIQKMAQKRALVAAVLVVTNCSDAFTQDIEEEIERPERSEPQKHEPDPSDPPALVEFLSKFKGVKDDEFEVSDIYNSVAENVSADTAKKCFQMFGNPDKDPSAWRKIGRELWLALNPQKK